jgi:enamine deaminase RidA (YjgF/YER057c/UK114 family)
MKRLMIYLLFFEVLIVSAQAVRNVTLMWSPISNPIVAGFNIYYGGVSGVYTNKTDVGGATILTISNLLNGKTYYFAISTYSAAGAESALSGEISYTVPVTVDPVAIPLSVQVFGLDVPNPKWGSLSAGYTTTYVWIPGYGYYPTTVQLPGYTNGTLLAVNENYTLTAIPAPGFAFTNWSDGHGNLLTNGPILSFTMATNLALVANFVDITRPTLSIVSPTLNQQWSNGTFTASGKANDNVAVATVYYSLNGAPWTNATTVNNWTNWSASLPLVPGTNTLQAFALDTSGNASTTNSVSFEYVVPMPLSVQVFGLGVPNPKWGSLSAGYTTTFVWIPGYGYYPSTVQLPGYTNGTLLAINENYVITAVANPGFAFTNWSDGNGNLLTNGPTLGFTMATNLALVANFVDITRPTLSIVSPTLNQQWSNGTFTASGIAGDNVAVATVYYSLNAAPWTNATTANNWTNWSASLPLVPGTNTLQAFALDASGNASTTNAAQLKNVANTPLAVTNPAAPGILSPAKFTHGQFSLEVLGTSNAKYIVQASTNLVNWVSVQTNTAPFDYVDTNAGQFSQRFYRTASVP